LHWMWSESNLKAKVLIYLFTISFTHPSPFQRFLLFLLFPPTFCSCEITATLMTNRYVNNCPTGDFDFKPVTGFNKFLLKLNMLTALSSQRVQHGSILKIRCFLYIHSSIWMPSVLILIQLKWVAPWWGFWT